MFRECILPIGYDFLTSLLIELQFTATPVKPIRKKMYYTVLLPMN